MANIKGITIEIGGNTTKLVAALRDVDKQVKDTQKELKEVDKLLKMDPGNTELLTQKQKLLTDAIEVTKDKLDKEKTALEQLKNADQNETTKKQQENLKREIEKTTQELQKLEGEYKKFGSVAGQQLQVAGQRMQDTGKKITGVGRAFAPVSAAATAAGVSIAKTAMNYEAQMSKVKAISGATGVDFDKLKTKAREMGAKTAFSATEAGEAFEYMAMAGWKTDDMLNGIEGVMNLAAASGESLGRTSDIVTDALSAFGMQAKDSGRFADILTAAANNANTNVGLLGESFKYIAPTAGAFKYSAEDVAIALGLMANAGIKGSQAGTTLNAALVNLIKPTDEQATAMAKLGLISMDTIKKIDFSKVEKAQNKVKIATANVETAQVKYNETLKKYPATSSQAVEAHNKLEKAKLTLKNAEIDLNKAEQGKTELIIGQNKLMADASGKTINFRAVMDKLRSTLGQTNIEVTDANGNIKDYDSVMASANEAGLNLTQMQTLQNAAIIFGKRALPGMLALINASETDYQKLAGAIDNSTINLNKMSEAVANSGADLETWCKEKGLAFADVTRDIAKKVSDMVKSAGDDSNKLNDIVKILFRDYRIPAEDARKIIGAVQEEMKNFEGTAAETAKTMLDNFKGRLTILKSAMQELALQLAEHLMPVLEDIVAYIKSWVEWFQSLDDGTKKTIIQIGLFIAAVAPVLIILGQIITAIGTIMTALGGLLTFAKSEAVTKALKASLDGFKTYLIHFKTYITSTLLPAIKTAFTGFITWIKGTAIPAITTALSGLLTWITSTALPAIGSFVIAWGPVIAVIGLVAAALWLIYDNWDTICEKCKALWEGTVQFFKDLWTVICGIVKKAWEWITEKIKGAWEGIVTYFSEAGKSLVDFFANLGSRIWDAVVSVFDKIIGYVQSVIGWIKEAMGFSVKTPKVDTSGSSSNSSALQAMSTPVSWYKKAMDDAYILNSPTIFGMSGGKFLGGGESGSEAVVGTAKLAGMIKDAVSAVVNGGTTVIPVYIGQERIEEIVVRAHNIANYRSGGR